VTVAENRIDELRRRLDRDPGSRLFAQLAEEHRKGGNHAEAIRVARAGLAVHQAYPSARLTLGRALLDSGDPAAARVELVEVLREAPDNILASRFLGQALEMEGNLAGALEQYVSTLRMAPGDRQLEAQVAALRLRAQPGGRVVPEVTAPMRPLAPPLPPGAGAAPRLPAVSTTPPARPAPPPAPRPAAGAPPPTQPMVHPPTGDERRPEPSVVASSESRGSMRRPAAAVPPEETGQEAPTLPKAALPELSALVRTLPPAEKTPAAAVAWAPVGAAGTESSFDETLDPPSTAAAAAPAGRAGGNGGPVDLAAETVEAPAPQAERASQAMEYAPRLEGPADTVDGGLPVPPALPAASDPAADTLSPPDPAATSPALSSSTIAELYLRQGLTERAREVYRQVLAEDPGNERARAGLHDLDAAAALGGPVAERAARRAALQRTIEALEAMLAAVRRD
jgi:tetratricopeptide (TPR) repeat protein